MDIKEALDNFRTEYETSEHWGSDLIIEFEVAEAILNELDKKDKIIDEYLKECYQFRAFCRRVRKDKKQDVDMFNQGREYSYIQFLNLVQGEEKWSYEGNNFKKVEKELEQYTKKAEGK